MPTETFFKPNNLNHQFLLAAINPHGTDLSRLFKRHSQSLDWDWLLTFSQKNKISGILIESLNRAEIKERLPPKTQNMLSQFQHKAKENQKQAYYTLTQISNTFDQEEIPFLVLKGIVFSEEIYSHPSVRTYHDIDLLVQKRFLRKAEDVLASIGYNFYYPSSIQFGPLRYKLRTNWKYSNAKKEIRQLFMHYHFHFPFILPWDDNRLPVDLHWDVFPPNSCTMDFWEFSRVITIGNLNVQTLSVESIIVYLARVIALKGFLGCKLLALCDFVRYLDTSMVIYDSRLLWEIVDKLKMSREFKISLSFATRMLNTNIPKKLNHLFKYNRYSKYFVFPFRYNNLLFEPESRRSLFQKIFLHVLWELALLKFPKVSLKLLIYRSIAFLRKRILFNI